MGNNWPKGPRGEVVLGKPVFITISKKAIGIFTNLFDGSADSTQ